jgi:hypothetical protein
VFSVFFVIFVVKKRCKGGTVTIFDFRFSIGPAGQGRTGCLGRGLLILDFGFHAELRRELLRRGE